jgi:hypothetical protein
MTEDEFGPVRVQFRWSWPPFWAGYERPDGSRRLVSRWSPSAARWRAEDLREQDIEWEYQAEQDERKYQAERDERIRRIERYLGPEIADRFWRAL